VPCFEHPLGKQMAPWADRLAMVRLAFASLGRVEVSEIEASLPRPSFTLRTVEALVAAHPGVRWFLVVGSDTLRERDSWHRFDDVVRQAELLVVGRRGYESGALDFDLPDVNSTELRRRLAAGTDLHGWLDPAVEEYVRERGLYGRP
jgi:nicotinate-nucleotide adenylyltransferase